MLGLELAYAVFRHQREPTLPVPLEVGRAPLVRPVVTAVVNVDDGGAALVSQRPHEVEHGADRAWRRHSEAPERLAASHDRDGELEEEPRLAGLELPDDGGDRLLD